MASRYRGGADADATLPARLSSLVQAASVRKAMSLSALLTPCKRAGWLAGSARKTCSHSGRREGGADEATLTAASRRLEAAAAVAVAVAAVANQLALAVGPYTRNWLSLFRLTAFTLCSYHRRDVRPSARPQPPPTVNGSSSGGKGENERRRKSIPLSLSLSLFSQQPRGVRPSVRPSFRAWLAFRAS